MIELTRFWAFICVLLVSRGVYSYVEAVPGTVDLPATHFEPQVAMYCGSDKQQAYHSQYMTESGHWVTDLNNKALCLKEKVEILEYCKKVYPKRDITNIVEASHYQKVSNWCKVGHKKCKGSHSEWVKPYRCLEGPFQSDALLVPENCLFDHIHNQTKCWQFDRWNVTAAQACLDRDLSLRSFAMLLPCGISLFSGVEFVCCPKHFKDNMKPKKPIDLTAYKGKEQEVFDEEVVTDEEEEEDDEEDNETEDGVEEEEEDYVEEDASSSTAGTLPTPSPTPSPARHLQPASPAPVTQVPTPDPYFTHFDPRLEHQAYKDAQQRLEEMHREKVTKVMKDWSDLEVRTNDPKGADEFKKRMTQRFQKTVQALEEEGDAEKHQLVAMHQQRVMAHINERKKEAMGCYTQALNDSPPNTHRVQKCLQKLLRALHKDRHHTISHYRHLLTSSFEQAEREKTLTLEHLTDIDKMVNQSLQMLDRFPDLRSKIGQLMEDYIQALRSKDETPGSLLAMTRDAEAAILEKYRADVAAKQEEKERQRELERQRKEQRKKERVELREEKHHVDAKLSGHDKFDPETMEDEHVDESVNTVSPPSLAPGAAQPHTVDVALVAHAQANDVSHGEATYSVRREVYHRESKSIYFTLAFAGIALMAAVIVGVAVLRRRSARSPQNQGFVEVDQAATPEERHVANMQINGYENPTYKYFEVKE
ncbi:beta-amyloid-like protein [Zootermopsis nevadensis]|uniref:beta-amyloid-like protein n=1 Tax=Zootermopsis nevadensis TaxID=136037 RepID=UPI000B8E5C2C|nr:beta-amyloid-like protein [Zootermopsis nevadensis]